jgi:allantoicase
MQFQTKADLVVVCASATKAVMLSEQIPTEVKDFTFFQGVHTSGVVYQAFYSMAAAVSVAVKWKCHASVTSWSCTSTLPHAFMACTEIFFTSLDPLIHPLGGNVGAEDSICVNYNHCKNKGAGTIW